MTEGYGRARVLLPGVSLTFFGGRFGECFSYEARVMTAVSLDRCERTLGRLPRLDIFEEILVFMNILDSGVKKG